MSRAFLPRKVIAPLYSFEPERLRGANGLECALLECQNVMHEGNFELVIEDLLTKPNLLQLVISGKFAHYLA
jgi:hypothetical protein